MRLTRLINSRFNRHCIVCEKSGTDFFSMWYLRLPKKGKKNRKKDLISLWLKILLNISEKLLYYGNDDYYIYIVHIYIYIYIYQYFIFIILIYLIILYQSRYTDKREFNWKCWLIQFINVLCHILLLLVILRYIVQLWRGKKNHLLSQYVHKEL